MPKEIRRTLRIREGDPLEIYTDREGGIVLRKYSPIGELSQFSKQYAEALAQTLKNSILDIWENTSIEILPTRGLCSYYAERGGLIVSY